jgi:class 3 adenylate cyclase
MAARIAALAQGGEILVSQAVTKLLEDVNAGDRRRVTLRGFSQPVDVQTIEWG